MLHKILQNKKIEVCYKSLIKMSYFLGLGITLVFLILSLLTGCDDNKIPSYRPINFLLSTEASSHDTLQALEKKWLFCERCLNDKKCLSNNVHECKTVTIPDRENALGKAIHGSNIEAVHFLVDVAKTDINKASGEYKYTPLMISAYYGDDKNLAIARFLISRGADINGIRDIQPNSTALMIAIWKNNTEFVRFLLKNGADPSLTSEGKKEGAACKVARANERSEIVPIIPGCCSLIAHEPDRIPGLLKACR